MHILFIVIVLLIVTLWLLKTFRSHGNSKYPPGPPGHPILGHLLLLGVEPWKTFLEWKKTYGPVISVRFGSFRTVVIQDDALLRQAFSHSQMSDRPTQYCKKYSRGFKGIVFAQLDDAIEQRQFFLKNLRDFGYGKKTMEEQLHEQVQKLMNLLETDSNCGYVSKDEKLRPIRVNHQLFTSAIVNSLLSIFMSQSYEPNDPKFLHILNSVSGALKSPGFVGELSFYIPFFDWLDRALTFCLPGVWKSGILLKDMHYNQVWEFARKEIERHEETRIKEQPRDFIDVYLDKMEMTTDVQSSFHKSRGFLEVVVGDILLAALDTTTVALEWLVVQLVRNPSVQTRIYEEICKVTGDFRQPTLNDRPEMPVCQAVLYELLRSVPFVPFGIFHYTNEDVQLNDYVIPQGTAIYPNFYGIHWDPQIWPDPKVFNPDRFLDEDGKFRKRDGFMAFSVGRRVCPGQSQAMDTMFLFMIRILQKFKLESWEGILPSTEWIPGIVCTPKEFDIKVTLRSHKVEG